MNINKDIKKQNKSIKRFLLLMVFIFFMLIAVVIFTKSYTNIILTILVFLELLILSSIVYTIDYFTLEFRSEGYKLVVKQGLFGEKINISGDKVVLVYVEEKEKEFNIVMISSAKIRSKLCKKVDKEFLINNGYISSIYINIVKKNKEEGYYYLNINKGGLKKYKLLNSIYKTCVYAEYGDKAISKIKHSREGIN